METINIFETKKKNHKQGVKESFAVIVLSQGIGNWISIIYSIVIFNEPQRFRV